MEGQDFLTKMLITTSNNSQGDIIVSGRELHEFLGAKTRYNDWFERMTGYGFEAGVDYVEVIEKVHAQKRVRTYEQVDHHLKLDMAKEISMIQRTERGKQARQYFIEVEKRYKAAQPKLPSNYKEASLI